MPLGPISAFLRRRRPLYSTFPIMTAHKNINSKAHPPSPLSDLRTSLQSIVTSHRGALKKPQRRVVEKVRQEYHRLSKEEKVSFFSLLSTDYGSLPHEDLKARLEKHLNATITRPEDQIRISHSIHDITTPEYENIFKTIVSETDDGIGFLVEMRGDLLDVIKEPSIAASHSLSAGLRALNVSLQQLISLCFAAGFLELRRITYKDTGGAILEKIVTYESVHPVVSPIFMIPLRFDICKSIYSHSLIAGKLLLIRLMAWINLMLEASALLEDLAMWSSCVRTRFLIQGNLRELKKRLGKGRRCFAFFHPCLPGEPLVFVHVALVPALADSMQYIADNTSHGSEDKEKQARAAIFYSINSTQKGLKGIDLGNFLIKQVAKTLNIDFPQLTTFATLSPVPNFLSWLRLTLTKKVAADMKSASSNNAISEETILFPEEEVTVISVYGGGKPVDSKERVEGLLLRIIEEGNMAKFEFLRPVLMRLCHHYLVVEKRRGQALDPVANFHLRNGARIERLNWKGDTSSKGLRQSAGMMVNYLYELDSIETNHEEYVLNGTIACSLGFSAIGSLRGGEAVLRSAL